MTQKKVSRYRAIARDLTDAIVARKYPLGSALPPESGLCQQLQARRHTVREALRILEETGLIARRRVRARRSLPTSRPCAIDRRWTTSKPCFSTATPAA